MKHPRAGWHAWARTMQPMASNYGGPGSWGRQMRLSNDSGLGRRQGNANCGMGNARNAGDEQGDAPNVVYLMVYWGSLEVCKVFLAMPPLWRNGGIQLYGWHTKNKCQKVPKTKNFHCDGDHYEGNPKAQKQTKPTFEPTIIRAIKNGNPEI